MGGVTRRTGACLASGIPCLCLSALAAALAGDPRAALWYAAVLLVLSHISAVDMLYGKIRTRSVGLLFLVSLPSLLLPCMPSVWERLASLIAVGVSAAAVILVSVNAFHVRRPMGGGDIRLMAVMSLLLGPDVIQAVAVACTVQLLVTGVPVMARKKTFRDFAGTRTCLGPYLALGTAAVLLRRLA